MEDFLVLVYIIILIWGILNIILFLNIWGMTNDVCDIRELLYKIHPQAKGYYYNSKYKINDIVVNPDYNGDLRIFDVMGNGEYNCKDANTGATVGFYKENELKLKE